jgi:hypothetical protein
MNNINLLRQTLKPHLKWHGARLSFLALFLIALFRVKTVNLAELSTGFMGQAKAESNYKRLQRFLREFDLDYYIELFSDRKISYLSADREFLGHDWLEYLLSQPFGIFKSRGFNLEDTHLVDSERLSRLFALLTVALCWAYLTGQWFSEQKPIKIKKHGRKAKSIFGVGECVMFLMQMSTKNQQLNVLIS